MLKNRRRILFSLDSGYGSGELFNHDLIDIKRPYFLAGGLDPENVGRILKNISPYAVDVSSGIETDGVKDFNKMKAFARTQEGKYYDKLKGTFRNTWRTVYS